MEELSTYTGQSGPQEKTNLGEVLSLLSNNDSISVPVTINIMLVGKTGAGKSTLVNTIFGVEKEEVAKVEHGGSACEHDEIVMPYRLPFVDMPDGRKIQVIIYDTVGFGESSKQDQELLRYIQTNVKKVHLLLVCHKLYDKVDGSTVKFLKALTESCTKDILNNMIFLLTHGDAFVTTRTYRRSQGGDKQAIKEEFETRFENMKDLLCQAVAKNFPKIKVEELKFCPTCDDRELALPYVRNWEYDMWFFILHKCDKEAQMFLSCFARLFRKIEIVLAS